MHPTYNVATFRMKSGGVCPLPPNWFSISDSIFEFPIRAQTAFLPFLAFSQTNVLGRI